MTLDEAIAHAREVAKEQKSKYDKCPTRTRYNCAMCFHNPKCDEDAKEHEQLAEWLEELKKIKSSTVPYYDGFKEGKQVGYNKAICAFVGRLHFELLESVGTDKGQMEFAVRVIDIVAEQLKESGAK